MVGYHNHQPLEATRYAVGSGRDAKAFKALFCLYENLKGLGVVFVDGELVDGFALAQAHVLPVGRLEQIWIRQFLVGWKDGFSVVLTFLVLKDRRSDNGHVI